MKGIFLGDVNSINRVYPEHIRKQLLQICDIDICKIYTKNEIINKTFKETEYIFSTWGMPSFSKEEIERIFPCLKAVFYAAGSVQHFARPFIESGVSVFSAWAANAVPVAEYTVAQIILANKGYYNNSRLYSSGKIKEAHEYFSAQPGNYSTSVGIIGLGMIGSMVAQRLRDYEIEVLAYDKFIRQENALKMGVKLCSLEELFERCHVVSNHLANNPQTVGMINFELLKKLDFGATFINTGRGAQVIEEDLIRILCERPDISALLDVTIKEPLDENNPLYSLENAYITTHIAGSAGNEVWRMAKYMIDEYIALTEGRKVRFEVSAQMLNTMA